MTSLLTAPTTAGTLLLVEPMPGFDSDREFSLTNIDPDGLLVAMRSTTDPQLRFVLTPAECFFPDYRPELGEQLADSLGVTAQTPVRLLLVLTVTSDLHDATANLRAPVVVADPVDGGPNVARALQVVLDDESLSMREPILPVTPPS